MNAEFSWWLLIVGLVVGAGLVWLVISDWSRREEDLAADERSAESEWIADMLRDRGEVVDADEAAEILALHREYLRRSTGVESIDAEVTAERPGEPEANDAGTVGAQGTDVGATDAADDRADDAVEAVEATRATQTGAGSGESVPDRPSVRTSRLSPRGGPSSLESEPPG